MLSPSKKFAQDNDVAVPNPPADGISSISLNGNLNMHPTLLVATSWDNTVNCYEIQYNQQTGQISNIMAQSQIRHDAPVLCSDISSDNVTVFSGGCDNNVKMWNVTQGPNSAQNIGRHDAPVKQVRYLPEKNLVVTGSWDKTIRIWDMRQPNPAASFGVSERVYAMDAKGSAVVAATADKQMHVFDMNSGQVVAIYKSPLAYQTRCVSIFTDHQGYAVGCIEGRIALEYFDEAQAKAKGNPNAVSKANPKSFAFKCHRDTNLNSVYSVNAIDFHPKNTFLSCGSDGVVSTWDKESRHRLTIFEKFKTVVPGLCCPISDAKFSKSGRFLVYAVSYDWSKGCEYNDNRIGNHIYIHTLEEAEITPKQIAPRR